MFLQTFFLVKSAFEQLSKMSRVCSTVVFIERVREREGILVPLLLDPARGAQVQLEVTNTLALN